MTLNSDAKFKKKLTFGFKYDMRNLMNFTPTTQKFENFVSFGSFCPKYIRFELKRYRGVCKIRKKTLALRFQKWYEKLGELSPEHSKV